LHLLRDQFAIAFAAHWLAIAVQSLSRRYFIAGKSPQNRFAITTQLVSNRYAIDPKSTFSRCAIYAENSGNSFAIPSKLPRYASLSLRNCFPVVWLRCEYNAIAEQFLRKPLRNRYAIVFKSLCDRFVIVALPSLFDFLAFALQSLRVPCVVALQSH
jgi:hypothetical protein